MSAWFKCFPRRIMTSYSALDSDQKACAYTLTMLIYDHDEPLRLPESMLAGACGFNVRKFKRVLNELVALGKFYIAPSGAIGNELADELLDQRRSAQETGRAGGKKRAANAARIANQLAIDEQSIDNQLSKDSEKTKEDNGTNQGPLGKAFNHKDIEVEKNSEAKASGADAPSEPLSVKAQIWAVGRPMFEKAGTSKAAAGAVIGKLIKVKGEIEALSIITALRADAPMDPEEYLWAVIHGKQALKSDSGAPQQLELVMIDGKPTMRPIARRAA